MDVAELVLDYVDVLKWPVFAAFIVSLLLLNREGVGTFLATFMERAESAEVTPTGLKLAFRANQSVDTPDKPLTSTAVDAGEEGSKLVEELRAQYEDKTKLSHEVGQLRDQYSALATEHVTVRLSLFYEQVYNRILPIQFNLLRVLSAVHPASLPRSDLEQIYRPPITPTPIWELEQVTGFLIATTLIEGVPGRDDYRLTNYGKGFFAYVDWQKLPEKFFLPSQR